MRITFLSDLNWEQHLRSVSRKEVDVFTMDLLGKSRYFSIQRYLQIVMDEKSDMVIVAGDVTGDGSCGHGFHHAFMIFIAMLEYLKIPTCFISGNHDEQIYYEQVVKFSDDLEYIHEISNKVKEINGIKILGVPYETTYSKSKIKNLVETFQDRYDIVVAHSQLKRRIRLFELDAGLILTGHYDRKLFGFSGSTFISLDNDAQDISYATVDRIDEETRVNICVKNENGSVSRLTDISAKIQSDDRNHQLEVDDLPKIDLQEIETNDMSLDPQLLYLKYLRGIQYLLALERLVYVKNDESLRPTLGVTGQLVGKQITANYKITESLIIDYLGKRTRPLKIVNS